MKLCSENVSQFPCFQRTNYRTKRENVSFMTSKLGRCRLIFPLFVSCCVCFFFFLPKLLLASSSQRTAIPQDKDHNHTHTHTPESRIVRLCVCVMTQCCVLGFFFCGWDRKGERSQKMFYALQFSHESQLLQVRQSAHGERGLDGLNETG